MPRSGHHLRNCRNKINTREEIARVDEAVDRLITKLAIPSVDEMTIIGELPPSFRCVGTVALPIAIRSLRKYRQRLSRVR